MGVLTIKAYKILVCLILLVMLPFCLGGCWQYKLCAQKNEEQVRVKLEELRKEYEEGNWDSHYCDSIECFSFAHFVFNNCFERGEKRLGTFIHFGEKYPMWIFEEPASDCYIAEQLNPDYTEDDLKKFAENLKPGDYLQMQWRKYYVSKKGEKLYGYHSAIVYDVDMKNGCIWFFDANFYPKNKIKKHSLTFEQLYEKIHAVSAYRYWNYMCF